MPHSLTDYRLAALALLPRGRAFALREHSAVSDLCEGLVAEFARIDAAAAELLDSAVPSTATALLPEWEEALGLLPDGDVAARQRAAADWLRGAWGNALADYQARLAGLGLVVEGVHYFAPFQCGERSGCADPCYGDEWLFTVRLELSGAGTLAQAAALIAAQLQRAHTVVLLELVPPGGGLAPPAPALLRIAARALDVAPRVVAFALAPPDPATLEAYRLAALRLLPRGRAFALHAGSAVSDLCEGLVAEFARIDRAATALLESSVPSTAVSHLSEWERALGLPDNPVPLEPVDVDVRQRIAADWLLGDARGNARADYERRLDSMDLYLEDVHYYEPFQCGERSACVDPCHGEEWLHTVTLDISGAGAPPGPVDTKAVAHAQAMIDQQLKRAHALVLLQVVAPSATVGEPYARSWLGTYPTNAAGEIATYAS